MLKPFFTLLLLTPFLGLASNEKCLPQFIESFLKVENEFNVLIPNSIKLDDGSLFDLSSLSAMEKYSILKQQDLPNFPLIVKKLVTQGGFNNFEIKTIRNATNGSHVTVALKDGKNNWELGFFPVEERDIVRSPLAATETWRDSGEALGFKIIDNRHVEIPNASLLTRRSEDYNKLQPNDDLRLAITYYETNGDTILDDVIYRQRWVQRAELPVGEPTIPNSKEVGHLFLHDITAHGNAGTIYKKVVDASRDAFSLLDDFPAFLKQHYPSISNYDFKKLDQAIAIEIDNATGNWMVFLESKNTYALGFINPIIEGADTPKKMFEYYILKFSKDPNDLKLREAIQSYTSNLPDKFSTPAFPKELDAANRINFLIDHHRRVTTEISTKLNGRTEIEQLARLRSTKMDRINGYLSEGEKQTLLSKSKIEDEAFMGQIRAGHNFTQASRELLKLTNEFNEVDIYFQALRSAVRSSDSNLPGEIVYKLRKQISENKVPIDQTALKTMIEGEMKIHSTNAEIVEIYQELLSTYNLK